MFLYVLYPQNLPKYCAISQILTRECSTLMRKWTKKEQKATYCSSSSLICRWVPPSALLAEMHRVPWPYSPLLACPAGPQGQKFLSHFLLEDPSIYLSALVSHCQWPVNFNWHRNLALTLIVNDLKSHFPTSVRSPVKQSTNTEARTLK